MLDADLDIRRFHEKVKNPPGDLANAGIYACHRSVKKRLDRFERVPIDFCRNVLARMEGEMVGWEIRDEVLIDSGNLEAYERAKLDPSYRIEFPSGRIDVASLSAQIRTTTRG